MNPFAIDKAYLEAWGIDKDTIVAAVFWTPAGDECMVAQVKNGTHPLIGILPSMLGLGAPIGTRYMQEQDSDYQAFILFERQYWKQTHEQGVCLGNSEEIATHVVVIYNKFGVVVTMPAWHILARDAFHYGEEGIKDQLKALYSPRKLQSCP